jgi:predicted  nucleic acid-binding Zn-ribbon protein
MYKLKLKQLYYLLVGRLQGAEVKRSEIERLLPEIDYALTYIEQLEKELVETKSKYLNQRLELNALRGLRRKNEQEITTLKKNIEKNISF